MKPFEGVRVLDFTQFTSGPVCTYIMADLGAEVIKIENPPYGDNNHYNTPSKNRHTSYITSLNHNKKTILMNMKDPEQQELFLEMVKTADLVIDNFKAGTLEKFGMSFERMQEANPKIVWTSISGYGQVGPWAKKTAYDVTIQAGSGLMSVTGEKGGAALKAGMSMSDYTSGLYACCGSIAAMMDAKRTGKGRRIDFGMLDSSYSIVSRAIADYYITGQLDKRMGREHRDFAPYNSFVCKDGKELMICVTTDEQFEALCKVLGVKAADQYAVNENRVADREIINQFVSDETCSRERNELKEALENAKVPCAVILNEEEAILSDHMKERELYIPVKFDDGTVTRIPALPIRMTGVPQQKEAFAHELGQDTLEFIGQFVSPEKLEEKYRPVVEDSHAKWLARTESFK
ncbi:MAG: CoA transferase [Lachnospiraceae bacterium]|nr:CoA transferase [Lachnospiraceae bacterium]